MINNFNPKRKNSIFYVFQPLIYTNKEEKHVYNIDFCKEILKRRISFIKKYLCCSYYYKTYPDSNL